MFTVLGEALLDMVQPVPGDTYQALPAGGPLNIAVGLRRLGHPTSMMARFSSGALGDRIRQYAIACDLDLSASVVTDQPVSLAFATIDEGGRASYEFHVRDTADWSWTSEELARFPPESAAIHTGSLATTLEPAAERIVEWWTGLADAGKVVLSFDPNVRPALAGPREAAVRRMERLVAQSHVVKASDEDLAWLYPESPPADAIRRWAQLGPRLAVLTQGPDGAIGVTAAGDVVELPAPEVVVVDTIGAGDAFQAGLLSGLADSGRLTPEAMSRLSGDDVREVLDRALVVAGLTCQRAGANPPTRAEYDAHLEGTSR